MPTEPEDLACALRRGGPGASLAFGDDALQVRRARAFEDTGCVTGGILALSETLCPVRPKYLLQERTTGMRRNATKVIAVEEGCIKQEVDD